MEGLISECLKLCLFFFWILACFTVAYHMYRIKPADYFWYSCRTHLYFSFQYKMFQILNTCFRIFVKATDDIIWIHVVFLLFFQRSFSKNLHSNLERDNCIQESMTTISLSFQYLFSITIRSVGTLFRRQTTQNHPWYH